MSNHHHNLLAVAGRRLRSGGTNPAFISTWLTTSPSETITLPLRSGFTYDMSVDWGDGSTSTVTAYNDADITHTFATAGTQTVSITGTCQAWYFNGGGDRLKFSAVNNWGNVGFTGAGLAGAFRGCSSATYFDPNITGTVNITDLSRTWQSCSSVSSGFPDINNLTTTNLLNFTWYQCTSAAAFPSVSSLTAVTGLVFTWYGCTSMTTVPVLPSASTSLADVRSAFATIGSGAGGTVVELWNTTNFPNISAYSSCFTGMTGLTNYADIPAGWK